MRRGRASVWKYEWYRTGPEHASVQRILQTHLLVQFTCRQSWRLFCTGTLVYTKPPGAHLGKTVACTGCVGDAGGQGFPHAMRTVNAQSTHSQHTVNTQSTNSQHITFAGIFAHEKWIFKIFNNRFQFLLCMYAGKCKKCRVLTVC